MDFIDRYLMIFEGVNKVNICDLHANDNKDIQFINSSKKYNLKDYKVSLKLDQFTLSNSTIINTTYPLQYSIHNQIHLIYFFSSYITIYNISSI